MNSSLRQMPESEPVSAGGSERETGRVQIDWFDKKTGLRGRFDERENYGGYSGSVCRRDDGGWELFIWEEGNYACDCNRSMFFLGPENRRDCEGENLVIESLSVWPAGGGPLEATGYTELNEIILGSLTFPAPRPERTTWPRYRCPDCGNESKSESPHDDCCPSCGGERCVYLGDW